VVGVVMMCSPVASGCSAPGSRQAVPLPAIGTCNRFSALPVALASVMPCASPTLSIIASIAEQPRALARPFRCAHASPSYLMLPWAPELAAASFGLRKNIGVAHACGL
jgi:hypothetical protein